MMRDGNGAWSICRVTLGAYLADLQEIWEMLGVAAYPADRCDPGTLAQRCSFAAPGTGHHQLRTTALMDQVSRACGGRVSGKGGEHGVAWCNRGGKGACWGPMKALAVVAKEGSGRGGK